MKLKLCLILCLFLVGCGSIEVYRPLNSDTETIVYDPEQGYEGVKTRTRQINQVSQEEVRYKQKFIGNGLKYYKAIVK